AERERRTFGERYKGERDAEACREPLDPWLQRACRQTHVPTNAAKRNKDRGECGFNTEIEIHGTPPAMRPNTSCFEASTAIGRAAHDPVGRTDQSRSGGSLRPHARPADRDFIGSCGAAAERCGRCWRGTGL